MRLRVWFTVGLSLFLVLSSCSPKKSEPGIDLLAELLAQPPSALLAPSGELSRDLALPFVEDGLVAQQTYLEAATVGRLRFYLHRPLALKLSLEGRAAKDCDVEVSLNGHRLGRYSLSSEWSRREFSVSQEQTVVGKNLLKLEGKGATQWRILKLEPNSFPPTPNRQLSEGETVSMALFPHEWGRMKLGWRALQPESGLRVEYRCQNSPKSWSLTEPGEFVQSLPQEPGVFTIVAKGDVELQSFRVFPPQLPTATLSKPRRGPVVIYMVDTLRADRLGCYGYRKALSPNIDAFAEQALLFRQATAQSPWTKPSVASLLTSHYPRSHGVRDYADEFPAALPTLAELLLHEDFRTAAFVANPLLTEETFGRGFQTFELSSGAAMTQLQAKFWTWLDAQEKPQDFFVYLHGMEPHAPYQAPPQFQEKWVEQGSPTWAQLVPQVERLAADSRAGPEPEIPSELRTQMNQLYDAEVAAVDDAFGSLLAGLKKRGLFEKTTIVVISDHGEELFDHGGVGHMHSLYRELIEVPLIVKLGGSQQGREVEEPVQQIDLMPTLLSHLGIAIPERLQGRIVPSGAVGPSFFGVRAGPDVSRVKEATRPWLDEADGVRFGPWVLARTSAGHSYRREPLRLNNLEQDPQEQDNLAFSNSLMREYLEGLLDRQIRTLERSTPSKADSARTRKALESLQYLP